MPLRPGERPEDVQFDDQPDDLDAADLLISDDEAAEIAAAHPGELTDDQSALLAEVMADLDDATPPPPPPPPPAPRPEPRRGWAHDDGRGVPGYKQVDLTKQSGDVLVALRFAGRHGLALDREANAVLAGFEAEAASALRLTPEWRAYSRVRTKARTVREGIEAVDHALAGLPAADVDAAETVEELAAVGDAAVRRANLRGQRLQLVSALDAVEARLRDAERRAALALTRARNEVVARRKEAVRAAHAAAVAAIASRCEAELDAVVVAEQSVPRLQAKRVPVAELSAPVADLARIPDSEG